MTHQTGTDNSHPRVIGTINQAIDLDAKDETALAVQRLTALLEEFPGAASIHAYLAWFLSRGGHFNEAIEHARQAVQLSQKSEKASLVLFHVLWKAGQQSQAIEEIRRFLAIRPSDEYTNILKKWEASEEQGDELHASDLPRLPS